MLFVSGVVALLIYTTYPRLTTADEAEFVHYVTYLPPLFLSIGVTLRSDLVEAVATLAYISSKLFFCLQS